MKNLRKTRLDELPERLKDYLEAVPPVTKEELSELEKAAEDLDKDPKWRADYMKGLFVANILEAMEQKGLSQTDVATRWGKTRQYVSKILNEDKRVNFTIETITELGHSVGIRVELHMSGEDEVARPCCTFGEGQKAGQL